MYFILTSYFIEISFSGLWEPYGHPNPSSLQLSKHQLTAVVPSEIMCSFNDWGGLLNDGSACRPDAAHPRESSPHCGMISTFNKSVLHY